MEHVHECDTFEVCVMSRCILLMRMGTRDLYYHETYSTYHISPKPTENSSSFSQYPLSFSTPVSRKHDQTLVELPWQVGDPGVSPLT